MKRLYAITAAVALVGVTAAVASAAPSSSTIVIRHQLRGCHAWSVNGGTYKAAQSTTIGRRGTITIVDNDVMSHKLVQLSGPAVRFIGKPAMSHVGASVRVVFPKAGVYRFTTKAGEDYMKGVKTIGEDNVLKLRVKVS